MEGATGGLLIGREADLARLHLLASSPGRLVIVTGEAGVGKTTLVNEFVRDVLGSGGTVIRGFTPSGGARRFTTWGQPARALGIQMPDTDPSIAPGDQEWELTDLLVAAIREHAPAAVVLEDLHRADPSSLAVLATITHHLVDVSVAFIGTVRDEAGARNEALESLLRTADVVPLHGLERQDVSKLVTLATGTSASDETLDDLVRRTGGNPLLVRELVAAGGDGQPPVGVVELLASTIERLGPDVLDTLGVLAVAGPGTTHSTIAPARGVPIANVAAHLEVAAEASIIERRESGRWFRHDLLADAAVHRLGRQREREIHMALAELCSQPDADQLVARARHLSAAVPLADVVLAVDAALAAAAGLVEVRRAADAGDVIEATIGSLADHGMPALHESRLWHALGEARWRAGDEAGALDAFALAAERADAAGDIGLLVACEVARYRRLIPFFADPVGRDRLADLDRRLPPDDSALRVALLGRRAIFELQPPADRGTADLLTEAALAMARRVGEPGVVLGALSDRYFLGTTTRARLDERAALASEAIELARRAGRPDQMLIGFEWRFASQLEHGQLRDAARTLDEMEALAAISPSPAWAHSAAIRRAVVLALEGDRDAALAMTGVAVERSAYLRERPEQVGIELGLRDPIASIYGVADESLHDRIETSLQLIGAVPSPFLQIRAAHGEVHLGRVADARRRALRFLDQPHLAFEGPTPLLTLAIMTKLVIAFGERSRVDPLLSVFGEFTGLLATDIGHSPELPVDYYLGRLALLAGDATRASTLARGALEQARAMPSPPLEARSLALLADAQAAAGDHGAADAARATAEAIAEPIGLILPRSSRVVDTDAPRSKLVVQLLAVDTGWQLDAGGATSVLPPMAGIDQLRRLLAAPGREISAEHLAGVGGAGGPPIAPDVGPVLDARAKREYRARILDLQAEIDDADAMADLERGAKAKIELDALIDELRSATGLAGRDRRVGGSAERARVNVARNIRRAIAAIERVSPAVGAHLRVSIRTGHQCRYEPDPSALLHWDLANGQDR